MALLRHSIRSLLKTAWSAGTSSAAPGTLTDGAAVQREDLGPHKRWKDVAVKTIADYRAPFQKDEFRRVLKYQLPEASDEFLDHFADLADDISVQRKTLRKAAGAGMLVKMALGDVKSGAKIPMSSWEAGITAKGNDYSHLLSDQHRAAGYRLRVGIGGGFGGEKHQMAAQLLHRRTPVGKMLGSVGEGVAEASHAQVDPAHRRKGLGVPMYEAWLAHARNVGGATQLQTNEMSTHADGVFRKLAAKHGLDYQPKLVRPDDEVAAFDSRYAPTALALKNELAKGGFQPQNAVNLPPNAVAPNPHLQAPFFDETTATLHSPAGSWPARMRNTDLLTKFQDPDLRAFFDRAMTGWARCADLLRSGRCPQVLIRLAALVGQPEELGKASRGSLLEPDDDDRTQHPSGRALKQAQRHAARLNQSLYLHYDSSARIGAATYWHMMHQPEERTTHIVSPDGSVNPFKLEMNRRGSLLEIDKSESAPDSILHLTDLAHSRRDLASGLSPKDRAAVQLLGVSTNAALDAAVLVRDLFQFPLDDHDALVRAYRDLLSPQVNDPFSRAYASQHQAPRAVLEGKWGALLRGPDDAALPGSMLHWLAASGVQLWKEPNPFWLDRGPHSPQRAEQAAKQHQAWSAQYGEVGALILHFAHTVPWVLGAMELDR